MEYSEALKDFNYVRGKNDYEYISLLQKAYVEQALLIDKLNEIIEQTKPNQSVIRRKEMYNDSNNDWTIDDSIKMLKTKLDGKTDTSWEWCETVRMAINALEGER